MCITSPSLAREAHCGGMPTSLGLGQPSMDLLSFSLKNMYLTHSPNPSKKSPSYSVSSNLIRKNPTTLRVKDQQVIDNETCFELAGEWWKADTETVINQAIQTGSGPNVSDAYTINGLPGPLYNCSAKGNDL